MIAFSYQKGQTPLTQEEKKDLIPNLFTRQDLNEFEQENIINAQKWIMQTAQAVR